MTIALPGNLRDLVARAAGRPIYCTAPGGVRRKLMALAIETFRREVPEAEFVDVLTCYGNRDDHRRRWPRESARYGAVIVITSAENRDDPYAAFDALAGEHAINARVASEIDVFACRGRPIAWQAIEFPEMFWFARFAIEPCEWVSTSRWARILPAADAELFHPTIQPVFGEGSGEFATLFRAMAQAKR